MMCVCGGVHSAKSLRVSEKTVFFHEIQDAPEEVASAVVLLGVPVPCQGYK